MSGKKRGLSPVVATVLLLMITVAAVGIIAGYLIPFVKNNLRGTSCVKYIDYFKFDETFQYNCYDSMNYTAVSVRGGDNSSLSEKIKGFNLIFSEEGAATSVRVISGESGKCEEDGISMLDDDCMPPNDKVIIIPGAGEVQTYVYNASYKIYERARIRAVIEHENTEFICGESDSIDLRRCDISVSIR